jgi:hypothetical protein
VILEPYFEHPLAHRLLTSFVRDQLYDPLNPTDYFSLRVI